MPGGCSDSAGTPCYWPIGQGYQVNIPDPINGGILFYTTRQASSGTVTVSGGTSVTWVSGDKFNAATWGLGTTDTITINGVTKTIVQGSVTATTLTLTTSATNGTFAYVANSASALTGSTDIYNYFPATHTFSAPWPGGNATLTNTSMNLETDSHTLPWPADRQQSWGETIDYVRGVMWLTQGINGGKSWNSTSHTTTTWKLNLATKTWTGLAPAAYPVNGNADQAVAEDPDDNILIQVGSDGGPGFRTSIYCPTDLNPTPGTLTAQQTTDGCSVADSWATVTTTGATMPNITFPGVIWSPEIHKFILFGGGTGGGGNATFYSYAARTKTWTAVGQGASCSTIPAPNGGGNPDLPGMAYVPYLGAIFYHYFAVTPQDWVYDAANNVCTQLTAIGTGPSSADPGWGASIAFDPGTGRLISWPQATGGPVWEGQLSIPTLNVPITVQEALYTGGSTGINRTNEPFCQGVPIPDALAISGTSTSTLNLHGAIAGQFRILGTWPSGNAKWIKVCGIIPNLPAGTTSPVTLTNDGSGNFGGANLATDNGSTITVATGTSTFTIKKANYNVLDSAVVGSTTLLATSSVATRGLVILGPSTPGTFPNNVTCGTSAGQSPCTTVYSSANDSTSTAAIEENGPVMAVVRATGTHYDNASHPYMHFTAREYMFQNRNTVKVTSVLRNADYSTQATPSADVAGNTFNTSFKGFQSYELRLAPSITGTLTYTISTNTTPLTGTLNQPGGTDFAYLYQGQSQFMVSQLPANQVTYGSAYANLYTSDTGFVAYKNSTSLATGTSLQYPTGYADISDASGNGLEIGVYQMAAYWPKSLEFDSGGADVRVGIWPSENGAPTAGPGNGTYAEYQAWPAWSVHDIFLEFHTSAPTSLANDFLSFQHYLVARPSSVSYVNSTNVFPYPIPTPPQEDSYYQSVQAAASPAISNTNLCFLGVCSPSTPDRGVTSTLTGQAMDVSVYRKIYWGTSGPLNQEEFRWGDLQKFLQRGFTGRYLNSTHFYRMQAEKAWPHSDGNLTNGTDSAMNDFTWRSRPRAGSGGAELQSSGVWVNACSGDIPCATENNSANSMLSWGVIDPLHFHWYGMGDYYMLTGDETIHDALMPLKDYYLNNNTYQGGASGGLTIARAYGIEMLGSSALSETLASTVHAAAGETVPDSTDATNVLGQGASTYSSRVVTNSCLSGYPTGCTAPSVNCPGGSCSGESYGTNYARGISTGSRGQGFCPAAWANNYYRISQPFETNIEIEGILRLRRAEGSAWTNWEQALDFAYGLSLADITESYWDDGTSHWQGTDARYNGFRYEIPLDISSQCSATTPIGTGTATTSGTAVTLVSGLTADSTWVGRHFSINGFSSNVTAVGGSTSITLNASVGNYGTATLFQIDGPGSATASGTAVTWSAGKQFDSNFVGQPFGFQGGTYNAVTSVTDATHLTVTSTLGTVSSPTSYEVASISSNDFLYELPDTSIWDSQTFSSGSQTVWMNFYLQYLENGTTEWQRQFNQALIRPAVGRSVWPADYGNYQIASVISALNTSNNTSLQDVSFTFADLGSGNYQLTYTVPASTCTGLGCLRVKWSPTGAIVNSGGPSSTSPSAGGLLGYSNVSQTFTLSPATYAAWPFANTTTEPTPTPGVSQNFTVATATTGLVAGNFSVKALSAQLGVCSIVTSSPLTGGVIGTVYSDTIVTNGCSSPIFSLSSGSLPTGLGLNPGTGAISGTPTGVAGTASFTISVSDINGSPSQFYTLTTTGGGPGCSIDSGGVGPGIVGQVVSYVFTASNCGVGTLTWTVSSGVLPTGTSGCASSTGSSCTVSGTLSAAGTFTPNIHVTDGGSNTADDPLNIVISNNRSTINGVTVSNGVKLQ